MEACMSTTTAQLCSATTETGNYLRRSLPRRWAGVWSVLLAFAAAAPLSLHAQLGGSGTIEGTITDPSGALISGARVTAHNIAAGADTVRTSTGSGLYTLSPLEAGNYAVGVTAPGFETLVRNDIHVDGMQVLTLNLSLKVGSPSQTVVVTAAPPP